MSDDSFFGAFDELALDAPVVYNISTQNNRNTTNNNNTAQPTRGSSQRDITPPRRQITQNFDDYNHERIYPSTQSPVRRPSQNNSFEEDESSSSSEEDRSDYQPSVAYPRYNGELQSPSSPTHNMYRPSYNDDDDIEPRVVREAQVRKTLTVRITNVGEISMFDGGKLMFVVLLDAKDEKMHLIDEKKKKVAYIQKSPIALHARYKLRLPNGFRVGKCTKRFKPNSERKFNYRKSDTREIFKMVGPFGRYKITKSEHQQVGSWRALEIGQYQIEVNAPAVDVFHIIALSLIGVIDHMSS